MERTCLWPSVAALSLAGAAQAAEINVTINAGDVPNQMPASFLGWEAYLGPGSVWGDDAGNGWGANPNGQGSQFRTATAQPDHVLESRYDLSGMMRATLGATFRIRATKGAHGMGLPVLSLQLPGGYGVSLNVGDRDYPASPVQYWYQLVQFNQASERRLLRAIASIPHTSDEHEDPDWQTADIALTASGHVTLTWNGEVVYQQFIQPFGDTFAEASWGSNTELQRGGGDARRFWTQIRLAADDSPPPPAPQNLLINGGFDTGQLAPWTTYLVDAVYTTEPEVHDSGRIVNQDVWHPAPGTTSGSYALAHSYGGNFDGGSGGAYQEVSVVPGALHQLIGDVAGGVSRASESLWEVRIMEGPWNPGRLTDFDTLVAYSRTQTTAGGFNWQSFSYEFTPSTSLVTVYVRYRAWTGAWDWDYFGAYFDSLALLDLVTAVCNTETVWADADGDGDVDQDDFAVFQTCYTGSAGSIPASTAYCACFDRDLNGRIDETDLTAFDACVTGPAVPWSPELTPNCVP